MNIIQDKVADFIMISANQINKIDLADVLTVDNTSIFYIISDKRIIGAINKKDLSLDISISLNKSFIFNFDHIPSSDEINRIFKDNSQLHRISVWVDGDIYAEYRDIDYPYLPKTIAKNIICLRYIDLFKWKLTRFFGEHNIKEIGIIGDKKIIDYFAESFNGIRFEECRLSDYPKFEIIFDFKYGKYLRRVLKKTNECYCDFSSFLLPIICSEIVNYLERNGVNYTFIYDSVFEGMKCLSEAEIDNAKNHRIFDDLIENESFLKEVCATPEDFVFLKERCFEKTVAFYSGMTIRQTNINGEELNVKNGVRNAGTFYEKYETEIHFFGPCSVFGLCGPDDYTFEFQLQTLLNADNRHSARVFNHGVMLGNNAINSLVECALTDLRSGDFVFIYVMENEILNLVKTDKIIYLKDIFNRWKIPNVTMFFDVPGHCNRTANKILAKEFKKVIDRNIRSNINESKRCDYFCREGIRYNEFQHLDVFNPDMFSHFQRLKTIKSALKKYSRVGTVTIYASPYTKGHEYLINSALKIADALVVFVVVDNFHTFNSIDRLNIVRRNLESNKRVFIIPSEGYFASKQYFPEYATKTYRNELSDSVCFQEAVSCKYVYNYLGITVRFLGDEKNDEVTSKYNAIVKKCCNENDIEVVILPRFKIDGIEVSGRESRKVILKNDVEGMRKLLPDPTVQYIINEMKS